MAINRFSTPVESEYISQYVPIPFEQLYALGKEYNERFDKNVQRVSDYIKESRQFDSPIKKDVEDYYNIAMNPQIKDLIESASNNPDIMKTQGFRKQLDAAINAVDYSSLRKLQSSANNAYEYLKAAKQLAAKGQYNKNWDLVDFNTYSTLDSDKIFDEVSPIQYQTLQEIINPYVENIQETFYENVDPNSGARMPFTNWMAVTENDIRNILNSRYSDIINTPQGQMWYRDIAKNVLTVNPNATATDIDNAFTSALVDASRQYIRSKPIQNKLGFDMWKYNQEHPEVDPNVNKPLTRKIEERGMLAYSNFEGIMFPNIVKDEDKTKINRLEQRYQKALDSGNKDEIQTIQREYSNIRSKYGLKDYVQSILFDNLSGGSMQDDINMVSEALIIPYAGSREMETALQSMPNSFKDEDAYGIGMTVSNIGDYELLSDAIMRLGNAGFVSGNQKKVRDFLKRNRIVAHTIGVRGAMPIASGNMNVTQQAINREDLLPLTYDNDGKPYNINETNPKKIEQYYKNLDKIMKDAGFVRIDSNKIKGYSTSEEFNTDSPYGKGKGDIRKQYTGGGVYYSADFVNRMPKTGESGSDDFNNYYDKQTLSGSDASKMFTIRQRQQQQANYDDEYYSD